MISLIDEDAKVLSLLSLFLFVPLMKYFPYVIFFFKMKVKSDLTQVTSKDTESRAIPLKHV